ncbi:unnamed protein product [Meloidogyne enterolobii]|uniref:Uncharacterized protein n=1 Tax=Meloidogyne enterolobii TaxID=390850 RepID=A0ACB0Y6K6_MELEN
MESVNWHGFVIFKNGKRNLELQADIFPEGFVKIHEHIIVSGFVSTSTIHSDLIRLYLHSYCLQFYIWVFNLDPTVITWK